MRRVLGLLFLGVAMVHAAMRFPTLGAQLALNGHGSIRACADCHGSQGQGLPHFAYPKLAGLGFRYLFGALQSFADGRRLNGIMTPIARALTMQEMRAVATYYASFRPRPPRPVPSTDRFRLARGRRYYQHGDMNDRLIACARCHGRRGHGMGARFPWVAGQTEAYVKEQLRSFRAGARRGPGLGLMRDAARPLDARQIDDIALYVSVLGVRPPLSIPVESVAVPPIVPRRSFVPPRRNAIPHSVFGGAVRRGRAIFDHTARYAQPYVGNALSCSDCHLGEGREAEAGPMWAAAGLFPRSYQGHVTTLAARIQAAFIHSENGRAPPLNGPVLTDLLAYVHWMSRGEVIGAHAPGRGYPPIAEPKHGADAARGASLYVQRCAVCHGARGEGARYHGRVVFPPVWGSLSFGRRASLARTTVMAAFLKSTMPYTDPGTLTSGAAYDLAAFLEARPRPP